MGLGVIQYPQGTILAGQRGSLALVGQEEQTVPRAELAAFAHALVAIKHSPTVTAVELHSDCQALVDGYRKGQTWTKQSYLSGVWEEQWTIIQEVRARGITLQVHKVKAHTGLTDDISPMHRMGNDVADREANM